MAEDQDDNLLVGIDQNGNTAKIRSKWIPGPAAHYQAYLLADPTTGDLLRPASQDDVSALGTALAAILAELSGKLEPADLAALATAARQDAAKGVLDSILAALGTALPLPTGAATAAGVAEVRDRLPATAHEQPLTDAQMRATAVAVTPANVEALLMNLLRALRNIENPIHVDQVTGRLRVAIEAGSVGISTNQTLTNIAQHGGVAANSLVNDQMTAAWALSVRRWIS